MKKTLKDSLFLLGVSVCILGSCKFIYYATILLVFWPLFVAEHLQRLHAEQDIIVFSVFNVAWLILLPMALEILFEYCPKTMSCPFVKNMHTCSTKQINDQVEKQLKVVLNAEKVVIKRKKKKSKRKSKKK